MAEVFRTVNGRKLTKVMATHREVQERLKVEADFRAQIAAGLLEHEPKVRTGDSQIVTEHGDVDYYVVLDDTRGLQAALSIEFGRGPFEDAQTGQTVKGTEGLFILHKAFHLPGKNLKQRPKRGGDNLRE